MRSASMGRKSIPNWRRENSLTSTRFSKRSRRSCDGRRCGSGPLRYRGRSRGKTSNLQRHGTLHLRSWMLDVGRWMFGLYPSSWRVMGAWWPSRSSKPLSARSTGRGMFDSYPLRHSKCAMRNSNPRRGLLWTVVLPFRTPRSAFLAEGRWWSCHANRSLS